MKSMDFKSICRICLESNKQTFDIFTSYYAKQNLLYCEMLSNCTKVKPLENDGLPRLICKECTRQLKRTYAFNLQCEESEKTLKSYTENLSLNKQSDTSIKDDPDDIKCEDSHVKDEDVDISHVDNKNYNVKQEPNIQNDGNDSWDADDDEDNVALEQMKVKKSLKDTICSENNIENSSWEDYSSKLYDEVDPNIIVKDLLYEGDKVKKKRGRKKKEYIPGEAPPVSDSKSPHQCDVCGKILSTKSNLKAHKICHTELRPYKCKECPAAFRGHSALFQHRRVHTGETPYRCEYCSKPFRRRTGLVNHIRVHTGEKLFSCTICCKTFVQSAQLSIHMKRHKGDKTFLCQECGKGFPIKADLNVHQRTHNGEKPYSCHLCEKTFTTSGNLSIHVRIHNKEVRYKCKECHRGFVTCSSYNVHLKRHKGQRDYHCECGKTFYTSSALKQHKVVHTGVKKYQCKICERKFSQTSHLTRHFRRDHAKPNAPMPPSNHYRLVLPETDNSDLFETQKVPDNVKCEES